MTASVLLVDDEPANLLALEALLAPLRQRLVFASSGEEALRAVLAEDFALVLLDVHMRQMDGFETASFIRSRMRSRETPIIFLTAFDSEVTRARRAYDLGAFDYITKPYDPDILRHKVAAFVRLFEQARQLEEQTTQLRSQREELLRAADMARAQAAALTAANESEREKVDALVAAGQEKRVKDVFIAVLGHDLRNPLGAISTATALLGRRASMTDDDRAVLARISRAARRMDRLISDVLDFTRGALAGGIPIALRDGRLDEICRQAIEELQHFQPQRQLELDVVGDMQGAWDADRMAQVISNLVGNALQHSKSDRIRIALDGARTDAVSLAVVNRGSIPGESLARLFEPFKRGDTSPGGLGLGLYIVKEIVEAHGGRVVVSSDRASDETVFKIELPRGKVVAPPERH